MKLAALPAAALGLLALAGPAAAQSTTRPAGAGASASASATGTKVQATDLAAGDFPLWDPDNCRPENFGGKHEWSPGDCGIIERYLASNWVALYQKNSSNTKTGCDRWYWDYGKKDSCCGFWWQWNDFILCDSFGMVIDSPWNDVIDFGSIHNNFKQPQYECVPTNPTTGERAGPWSCIQSPKDHKSWIIARRVRGGASKPLDDVEGLVIEETWEGKGGFWSSTREGCLLGLQYYVDRQTDEPFRCSEGGYNWDPPHWCKVGRMGLPPPNDTNVPCADGTTWTQPTYLPKGTNNSWEVVSKLKTGTTTTPIEIAADPYNGIPQAQITFSYKTGATSRYIAPKTTTTSTASAAAAATTTSLPGTYITTTSPNTSSAASLQLSIATIFMALLGTFMAIHF